MLLAIKAESAGKNRSVQVDQPGKVRRWTSTHRRSSFVTARTLELAATMVCAAVEGIAESCQVPGFSFLRIVERSWPCID